MNIDPRVFDMAYREMLDYECFIKYPAIILACGVIILILDLIEKRRKNK